MNIPANFFTRMDNTKPFCKIGIRGFDGEGKSLTAVKIAIGLQKAIGSTKPVVVMNSEEASHFFRRHFEDAGLPVPQVRNTESVADLLDVMGWMREGLSDILLIDEISRYHGSFKRAYKERPTTWDPPQRARTRLDPSDRELLGEEWHEMFGRHFVEDAYHIIMCGRAGYNYEDERNEETGRLIQFKGQEKFRGDSQLGHLPDLTIEMERVETEGPDHTKDIYRRATVTKDRWDLIDGKTFRNPSFDDFLPHIELVLQRPVERVASPSRRSVGLFVTEDDRRDYKRNCEKAAENIEGLLEHAIPGRAAKDLQAKTEIIFRLFDTHSEQEWKASRLEDLRAAYPLVQQYLVDLGYAEWRDDAKTIFGVKGLPPISIQREQLMGKGYEAITPKPLREAHLGLDKLESQAAEVEEQPAEKSERAKRTEQFLALAREMKWTDPALQSYLDSRGVASAEKIKKADYMLLYRGLLDEQMRDQFIESSRCEAASRA